MGVKELRVLGESPFNAEPRSVAELASHPVTPLRLVYARNHSAIQDLRPDAKDYAVRIDGETDGIKPLSLTFRQIRESLPRKQVLAVLVCAGNRRAKMAEKTGRDVHGIKWSEGTIANVRWTGAPLRDLLLLAGVPDDGASWAGLHACFASNIEPCEDDVRYGGSIPLEKAMSEDGDVLLAYEMNGEPLTPDHGFPLRAVVPGCGGMRWVKWVDHVSVSRAESPNFYQRRDYKILPEHVASKATANEGNWWSQAPSMQNLPCNSVVTSVRQLGLSSSSRSDGLLLLKARGYAYSDRPIERVDVSVDGGASWNQCKITYQEGRWSWALWEWMGDVGVGSLSESEENVDTKLSATEGGLGHLKVTVLSRAKDEAGRVQELTCPWNLRGVGYCGAGEAVLDIKRI